jgi:hypothetical protein
LVRRSNKLNKIKERNFGSFHKLLEELQRSLILFGKENASRLQKSFDNALEAQQEACYKKEEIALQKNGPNARRLHNCHLLLRAISLT